MPSTAFAARTQRLVAHAPGLRSGLSLHRPPKIRGLGAARLVSTPSRLESPSGLGSGLPPRPSPGQANGIGLMTLGSSPVNIQLYMNSASALSRSYHSNWV